MWRRWVSEGLGAGSSPSRNHSRKLAPAVHLALYRQEQLVASLEEVLARLPIAREPGQASPGRSVVFITGTSRTADIEQILIRGVHGPKEVHAILVGEACLGN